MADRARGMVHGPASGRVLADTLKLAYFTITDVRKVRSRNVVQVVAEVDVSHFRELTSLDETSGVFIPASFDMAEGVYVLPELDREEFNELLKEGLGGARLTTHPTEPPKRGRSLAGLMHARGYFFNPKLWEAMDRAGVYTQAEHYEHVKGMDPINFYPMVVGEGDVVAHHCREASNSGTASKPSDFWTVPIYQSHHIHLHNHATHEEREEHIAAAAKITADRMKTAMKAYMNRDSLSGITREELQEFEREIGIQTAGLEYQPETVHSRRF